LGSKNNFAPLNSNFKEPQFWELALEHNFGEQLSATTLGQQLSGPTLENNFGESLWEIDLKYNRFGIFVLQRYFGKSFWKRILGSNFALGSSFGEPL
jgi:hypothetical protein